MTKPREKPEVEEVTYRSETAKLKHWVSKGTWEIDRIYTPLASRDAALERWREKVDSDLLDELTGYWGDRAYRKVMSVNGTELWACFQCAAVTDEPLRHYDWHAKQA